MARRRRPRFVALLDHLTTIRTDLPDPASAIAAGWVLVDGRVVTNPTARIPTDAAVRVRPTKLLRGTRKLTPVLTALGVPVAIRVALDVGAAAGGFTAALLNAGARAVYAVDAGHGQLAGWLRQDPRVRSLERTNLANLDPSVVPDRVDLITMDLSYLGIATAAPQLERLRIADNADLLALVKPMYELHLSTPPTSQGALARAVAVARRGVERLPWRVVASVESPLPGSRDAVEFFLHGYRIVNRTGTPNDATPGISR
jgi:23S rRNA (cytidine1920-2'-O)/16S rRNA (cytidine1409-2'-O)-methyltransferase